MAVVGIVLEHCDPDEIVLFGSRAKGTADLHSDIDLLVLGPFTTSPWVRGRELREALREIPVDVDLHLLTPAEYASGRSRDHGYLRTSATTARCLYRRGDVL